MIGVVRMEFSRGCQVGEMSLYSQPMISEDVRIEIGFNAQFGFVKEMANESKPFHSLTNLAFNQNKNRALHRS